MGKNKTTFSNGHKSSAFIDETGKKYNKLTVLERAENSKFGTAKWLCVCECGNKKIFHAAHLRTEKVKSCGCDVEKKPRSGNAVYNKLYTLTRWQAKKNNVPFDITLDDLKEIVHKKCEYCGRPPYLEKFAYHRTRYSEGVLSDESLFINGIDKIIPEKGYVKNNCAPCCKYCNRAKSDLTTIQFKELISRIYNNYCL